MLNNDDDCCDSKRGAKRDATVRTAPDPTNEDLINDDIVGNCNGMFGLKTTIPKLFSID